MDLQLEKLQLAYEYLQSKLAEIPRYDLLVIEKNHKGFVVGRLDGQSLNNQRSFPTIPFEKFQQYVYMMHYKLDIIYIPGHDDTYFYVKRVRRD